MFGKTYELSLARDYVSHWGMPEAMRELIQNALDSESPFVYSFGVEDDGTVSFELQSEFTVLTPQTLLLGSTSKREDADAIGSFGEGYKIALLVLTRMGYDVTVYNGDVMWVPMFRVNNRFGVEQLVIEERRRTEKTPIGLTFVVKGLSQDDAHQITLQCLKMQDEIGEVKSTKYGEILLEKPGKLYVGSLYICDTDLKFGYNIDPKFIKLERDRQTVSSWDLRDTTVKMWYDTKEYDRIAKMINDDWPDVWSARFDSPEMVKQACYELFREQNPGAVVAENQDQLKQLVRQGMERVVVVNSGMYHAVSTSHNYRMEPQARLESPKERLEKFLEKHRYNMSVKVISAFREMIDESRHWKLK